MPALPSLRWRGLWFGRMYLSRPVVHPDSSSVRVRRNACSAPDVQGPAPDGVGALLISAVTRKARRAAEEPAVTQTPDLLTSF